jgi:signal transduction histidine kinase/predicted metal-dependent phosphoesterase TrpH
MSKWLLSDLHIHSTFSDGTLSIEEVVRIYGEAGFDVIAITDHLFDTQSPRSLQIYEEGKSIKDVKAYFQKIEELALWAKETFDLVIIPGLEVCNLIEDYHILGIDLKEAINPNQGAEGVIEEIHRQGGIAVASHPPLKLSYFLQGDRTSLERHPLHLWKYRERYADKIDAWEIANREDIFGEVSLEHFPYLANSDFHERHHLVSWKSLIDAEKERESIKKAILEKKVALFFFNEKEESSRLPHISPPKAKALPHHDDKSKESNGIKILVADDECDLVEMLAYNLGENGYEILKAYDGFEAWQKVESEKPVLLILDLMMPNLDGWELCRLIRRNQKKDIKEMGILMLTARATPEDRVYGLEMGADDYLTKPFSLNELILRVGKLIEKRKSLSQLEKEMGSLRSSMEEKEVSLSKVVHDLRSPLISMGASAKRMLRKGNNEEAIGILKTIYNSSLQLTQWIDGTVLSSKGSKGKMREVDIVSMLKQVVELLKDIAIEKNIEIHLQSSDPVFPLLCNEQFLQRAFTNLISNAVKYTPEGGRVGVAVIPYLRIGGDGGILEISVKDTGMGIPKEDIEKIFEPFYRGKNATTEIGMGLGLFFVKEVVDLHGGRILVQSEPNKGSIFSILLPVGNNSQREGIEKQQPSSL